MTWGIDTRRLARAVLTAVLASCLVLSATATAKKKGGAGKAGKKIEITKVVNAPIPDEFPPPPGSIIPQFNPLISTIDIGKEGRGLRVRDVNVTVQTLAVSGMEPGDDVDVELRAPNGATSSLFDGLEGYTGAPSRSIGPLTLDDESFLNLGSEEPLIPTDLYIPWMGRATPNDPLAVMDNGSVMGPWALILRDFGLAPSQSNLVLWTLIVQTGKPYKTK